MNDLLIQIIAGLVVVIISGVAGFLIKSKFFQETVILPRAIHITDKRSYSHLNGKWYLYWLSFDPSDAADPKWMHGIQQLQIVNRNKVIGSTELVDHPLGNLHYRVQGEIRAGRMIATDTCIEDETEFASLIYPSLMSKKIIVGTFMGFDNLTRPIVGPAILSREILTTTDLNRILKQTNTKFICIAEYGAETGYKAEELNNGK